MYPNKFEVTDTQTIQTYSTDFRKVCAVLKDNIKYYSMMTIKDDFQRCCPGDSNDVHTQYEYNRI